MLFSSNAKLYISTATSYQNSGIWSTLSCMSIDGTAIQSDWQNTPGTNAYNAYFQASLAFGETENIVYGSTFDAGTNKFLFYRITSDSSGFLVNWVYSYSIIGTYSDEYNV